MNKKTLSDVDIDWLRGRTVIVRADLNVPLDDHEISDDQRIRPSLPTLTALTAAGARVLLLSQLGRPKGEARPEFSLAPVAARLDEVMEGPVVFVPESNGRSVGEADRVLAVMKDNGLERGRDGLEIYVMCEIPSNVVLAGAFAARFDGFSIGSNDLTQLTLGLDRDSALVADLFDERNAAVKALLSMAISAAKKHNKYVGICGQGPSDHPDLARWLMEQNIDSISLNPDTVVQTWLYLAGQEPEY